MTPSSHASRALAARAWGDFRIAWRQTLVFHLLMQLLGLLLFAPLIGWVGDQIVSATGEPVISNYDIAVFVLSPAGTAFVLIGAALVTGLLLAEFAGHSWIAGHAIARRPVTVISTVAFVLRRLPRLIGLSTRAFLRLAVLLLPFIAVAAIVWFTMLGEQDINYYLAENPRRVAARESDCRSGGARLCPASGVATHTLGVRRARPGIRRVGAASSARNERAHDQGPCRRNRVAPRGCGGCC